MKLSGGAGGGRGGGIVTEHVNFSLWQMEEADHFPEEAKSMGKSTQHKILIKPAPITHKVFPTLCIFYFGFCLNVHYPALSGVAR